jgi:hypothetical protein
VCRSCGEEQLAEEALLRTGAKQEGGWCTECLIAWDVRRKLRGRRERKWRYWNDPVYRKRVLEYHRRRTFEVRGGGDYI